MCSQRDTSITPHGKPPCSESGRSCNASRPVCPSHPFSVLHACVHPWPSIRRSDRKAYWLPLVKRKRVDELDAREESEQALGGGQLTGQLGQSKCFEQAQLLCLRFEDHG